jgi:hypothetical protein
LRRERLLKSRGPYFHHGLLAALDDTREQNDGAATNAMYAFINSVNAQRGTHLTNTQADSLVSSAERIIQAIGG